MVEERKVAEGLTHEEHGGGTYKFVEYVPDKDAHWSGPAAFADAFRL